MPLLSIIVPIYNTKDYLKKCVDSLLSQQYENIEIVLVDDCSTDGSERICAEYSKKHGNVIYIHKAENEGLAYARKDGVLASHGEYVGFVDSDDWIEPNMYYQMMKYVIMHGAEVVTCGSKDQNPDGSFTFNVDPVEEGVYTGDKLEWLKENLVYSSKYHMGLSSVSIPLKVYKKSLILPAIANVPKHLTYYEDLTYVFPPFFSANTVAITKLCLYHSVYRSDSMSRLGKEDELNELITSLLVAENVYVNYNFKVKQCFYKKAIQVIVEYLWALTSAYDEFDFLKEKWSEVKNSETVRKFSDMSNERKDDRLFRYIMNGKMRRAYIYQKVYRMEKRVENSIKVIIGYKK